MGAVPFQDAKWALLENRRCHPPRPAGALRPSGQCHLERSSDLALGTPSVRRYVRVRSMNVEATEAARGREAPRATGEDCERSDAARVETGLELIRPDGPVER